MESLMPELVFGICAHLNELEQTFLSFTCHTLRSILKERVCIVVSAMEQQDYKMLALAKRWNIGWNKKACRLLGEKDNLGIFHMEYKNFSEQDFRWIGYGSGLVNGQKLLNYYWKMSGSSSKTPINWQYYEYGVIAGAIDSGNLAVIGKLRNDEDVWFSVVWYALDKRNEAAYRFYLENGYSRAFKYPDDDAMEWAVDIELKAITADSKVMADRYWKIRSQSRWDAIFHRAVSTKNEAAFVFCLENRIDSTNPLVYPNAEAERWTKKTISSLKYNRERPSDALLRTLVQL